MSLLRSGRPAKYNSLTENNMWRSVGKIYPCKRCSVSLRTTNMLHQQCANTSSSSTKKPVAPATISGYTCGIQPKIFHFFLSGKMCIETKTITREHQFHSKLLLHFSHFSGVCVCALSVVHHTCHVCRMEL